MKADEVRLYALRGGLKKQSVCYTHFHSNKVFRGDHYIHAFPYVHDLIISQKSEMQLKKYFSFEKIKVVITIDF